MTAMKLALALIVFAALQSCATAPQDWLHASDEEITKCKAESCSVWTPGELHELIEMIFRKGFMTGRSSL